MSEMALDADISQEIVLDNIKESKESEIDLDFVREHDRERYDNIMSCGKRILPLRHKATGKIYVKSIRCEDWLCEICSDIQRQRITEKIVYYIDRLKLHHFFTLTKSLDDEDDLQKVWRKIIASVKMLHPDHFFERYKSKKKAAYAKGRLTDEMIREKYQDHWSKAVEFEIRHSILIDTRMNVAINLSKKINAGELVDKHSKKYQGMKYTELNEKGLHKEQFFQDYKHYFDSCVDEIIRGLSEEQYSELYRVTEEKMKCGFDSSFEWIRTLEFHENGEEHFHILTNRYIPHIVMQSLSKLHVYKNEDFSDLQGTGEHAERVGAYVGKYVTKDTAISLTKIQYESGKKKIREIITTSSGITLPVTKDDSQEKDKSTSEYEKMMGHVDKMPRKNWDFVGYDESDLELYCNDLLDVHDRYIHPNPYIHEYKVFYKEWRKQGEEISRTTLHEDKKIDREMKSKLNQEHLVKRDDERSRLYTLALDYEFEYRRKNVTPLPLPVRFDYVPSQNMEQDELQIQFLNQAAGSYIFTVLTGSAGTGKTTILGELLKKYDFGKVAEVSYTGRAVSRLREVLRKSGVSFSSDDVSTIHKICHSRRGLDFLNHEDNVLDYDTVIVDEAGMIPKDLFTHFLNALKPSTRVIVMGDTQQLLPVGSRSVLDELRLLEFLYPDKVQSFHLKKNYRSKDSINKTAYHVIDGEIEKIPFEIYDPAHIFMDIQQGYQVLTNTKRMTRDINHLYAYDKKDITDTAYVNYDVGDRVMILRNDKENEVFNGDFSTIVDYNSELQEVTLQAEQGNEFVYPVHKSAVCFSHSAAITVHKAQGSEFDKVSIVLDSQDKLLNRNLLYTAITRARDHVKIYILPQVREKLHLLTLPQIAEEKYSIALVPDMGEKRERMAQVRDDKKIVFP